MKTKTQIRSCWLAVARKSFLTVFALAIGLAVVLAACSTGVGACSDNPCILASDGLVLRGKIQGNGKPGSPGVILAHDFNADQGSWKPLATALTARGYLVLTFDFRGTASSPGRKDATLEETDLGSVLKYMRDVLERPNVFVIGAGSGGAAAIKVASRDKVKGVVALSAPENALGVSVTESIAAVTAPKLFIASQDEPQAADALSLFNQSREPHKLSLVPGSASGTGLLSGPSADKVRTDILAFLDANKG